eukprot:Selendium_serpulae@DN5044_c0_g1_i3.p1
MTTKIVFTIAAVLLRVAEGGFVPQSAANVFGWGVEDIGSNCLLVPSSMCIADGQKILSGKGVPRDMIGWWTFDSQYPFDDSRNGNHLHPAVNSGPGIGGNGASATFTPGQSAGVKGSESLKTQVFTISFWIYLLEDATGNISLND